MNKMNKRILNPNDGHFDDCPVCQAMKKMGIRNHAIDDNGQIFVTEIHPKQMEALRPAFDEARRKGGIVGGEWFA